MSSVPVSGISFSKPYRHDGVTVVDVCADVYGEGWPATVLRIEKLSVPSPHEQLWCLYRPAHSPIASVRTGELIVPGETRRDYGVGSLREMKELACQIISGGQF